MGLFYGFLQIIGWIETGYWISSHHYWKAFAFAMCTITVGLAGAMSEISKVLRENGYTSKSK